MPNLNSGIVDVGIALIYVFVLVSVLVSAVNELLAGLLKQRAKALHQGIGELLQSPALRDKLYDHALIKTLAPPTSWVPGAVAVSRLTAWLVKNVVRREPTAPGAMAGPSYIPKEAFSLALVDLLGGTEVAAIVRRVGEITQAVKLTAPSPELVQEFAAIVEKAKNTSVDPAVVAQLQTIANELKAGPVTDLPARLEPIGRALGRQLIEVMKEKAKDPATGNSKDLSEIVRLLATDAPASVEQVRKALEGWFDAGMERVAGWYKRWTQLWQFGIGLAIAATLNINIATIGLTLWTDVPLRNAIVAEAAAFEKNPQPGAEAQVADPATRIKQTRDLLKGTMVPIGWSGVSSFDLCTIGWMIPGWLLTAIGASFGAPFWFDLLGRVVQLRSGGRKPEEVAKAAAEATQRSAPAAG